MEKCTTVLPTTWPKGSSPPLWKQLTSFALNLSAYKFLSSVSARSKQLADLPGKTIAGISEDRSSHLWALLRSSTVKHHFTAQCYFLPPGSLFPLAIQYFFPYFCFKCWQQSYTLCLGNDFTSQVRTLALLAPLRHLTTPLASLPQHHPGNSHLSCLSTELPKHSCVLGSHLSPSKLTAPPCSQACTFTRCSPDTHLECFCSASQPRPPPYRSLPRHQSPFYHT